MVDKKVVLNFPPQFDIINLKLKGKSKNLFYCYNKTYYYKFSAKHFYFDEETNSAVISFKTKIECTSFFTNFFKKFIKSVDCYFFLKIKFKGKGYKIKFFKKKKIMKFYFGRSHLTYVRYKRIILKKNLKYKFVLKSNNLEFLKKAGSTTLSVKPINIFTLRGLRIGRSIIYKRKGKKGSYI